MLKAGASGYITKDSEPSSWLRAAQGGSGGRYIGAELAEQLAFATPRARCRTSSYRPARARC